MLCSETDTMAAIEASMALAEQLEAAEEEGRLKRQKQEEDDEKLALGIYNCECVCSLSLSFSLSLSLCRNPNFVRGRDSGQAHSRRQPREIQVCRLIILTLTPALQRGRSIS